LTFAALPASAYRSLEPVLQERLAVLAQRRVEDRPFVDVARGIAARRIGRIWGGSVALGFALASFLVALPVAPFFDGASGHSKVHVFAALLLFAGPLAGVFVALAVTAVAQRRLRAMLDAPLPLTGDATADLARIDAARPRDRARWQAARWERASVALPMAATSMLAPLLLHAVVWWVMNLFSGELPDRYFVDFGEWIAMSSLIVGHAHISVLVGTVHWSLGLPKCATKDLSRDLYKSWGRTLGIAVLVACAPGIVLLAVPPLLVAITGLAFLPAAYFVASRGVASERVALEDF
jgi:hypothetical protein